MKNWFSVMTILFALNVNSHADVIQPQIFESVISPDQWSSSKYTERRVSMNLTADGSKAIIFPVECITFVGVFCSTSYVNVFDVKSRKLKSKGKLTDRPYAVYYVSSEFSADGRYAVILTGDQHGGRFLEILDLTTFLIIYQSEYEYGEPLAQAFSPDSRWFAFIDREGPVILDLQSLAQIRPEVPLEAPTSADSLGFIRYGFYGFSLDTQAARYALVYKVNRRFTASEGDPIHDLNVKVSNLGGERSRTLFSHIRPGLLSGGFSAVLDGVKGMLIAASQEGVDRPEISVQIIQDIHQETRPVQIGTLQVGERDSWELSPTGLSRYSKLQIYQRTSSTGFVSRHHIVDSKNLKIIRTGYVESVFADEAGNPVFVISDRVNVHGEPKWLRLFDLTNNSLADFPTCPPDKEYGVTIHSDGCRWRDAFGNLHIRLFAKKTELTLARAGEFLFFGVRDGVALEMNASETKIWTW